MINSNNNDSLDFSGGKFITSATGILRIIVIVSISIYVKAHFELIHSLVIVPSVHSFNPTA